MTSTCYWQRHGLREIQLIQHEVCACKHPNVSVSSWHYVDRVDSGWRRFYSNHCLQRIQRAVVFYRQKVKGHTFTSSDVVFISVCAVSGTTSLTDKVQGKEKSVWKGQNSSNTWSLLDQAQKCQNVRNVVIETLKKYHKYYQNIYLNALYTDHGEATSWSSLVQKKVVSGALSFPVLLA